MVVNGQGNGQEEEGEDVPLEGTGTVKIV